MEEKPVRVLVANGPRLMRELVLAILADQPDIEVIGEIQDDAELSTAVKDGHPDVVILALDDSGRHTQKYRSLLEEHPYLRILALAPEQNRGFCYWGFLEVRSKPVESSEAGLLSILREPPPDASYCTS